MADNRNFVNKFANQGGGDIFVEDAKLSEISTKTAIASEGVMLKGTDGAYYEIDKASLSEVIRAELGAILADNSKNNGTSVGKVPTLNSSGNALGASSVADLASVLGVAKDFFKIKELDVELAANSSVLACESPYARQGIIIMDTSSSNAGMCVAAWTVGTVNILVNYADSVSTGDIAGKINIRSYDNNLQIQNLTSSIQEVRGVVIWAERS